MKKKIDALNLYTNILKVIEKYKVNKVDAKEFKWNLSMNKIKLQNFQTAAEAAKTDLLPDILVKFQEFEKQKKEVIKQFAVKKEGTDEVVVTYTNGKEGIRIPNENIENFNKEIAELRENYKDTLEIVEKNIADFDDYLNQDIKDEEMPILIKIKKSDIPDCVDFEELEILEEILDDNS